MTPAVWPAPDRSRLLDVGGFRVFVTDVGPSGPTEAAPVVLLHDVLTCGHMFSGLLGHADPGRRHLVIDLPGCGESDRPAVGRHERHSIEWLAAAVLAAIDACGLVRFELLGQGFGALVAMAVATERPDATTRLVASGPLRDGAQLAHELRLAGLPAIGTRAFARAYRRVDLERTLQRWRAAGRPDALAIDVYWDRLGRGGGVEATCDMLLQLSRAAVMGDRFATTEVDTLLLWGDADVVPSADRARWSEQLPRAKTVVLPRCGHAAVEEQPGAVARLLATPTSAIDGAGEGAADGAVADAAVADAAVPGAAGAPWPGL